MFSIWFANLKHAISINKQIIQSSFNNPSMWLGDQTNQISIKHAICNFMPSMRFLILKTCNQIFLNKQSDFKALNSMWKQVLDSFHQGSFNFKAMRFLGLSKLGFRCLGIGFSSIPSMRSDYWHNQIWNYSFRYMIQVLELLESY